MLTWQGIPTNLLFWMIRWPIQLGCENTATVDGINLHHLGCIKGSMEKCDTCHINWLAGFLPGNSSNSNKGKLRFTIYMQASPKKISTILVVTGTIRRGKHPKVYSIMVGIPDSQKKTTAFKLQRTSFNTSTNKHTKIAPQFFCMRRWAKNCYRGPIEIIFHQPGY